MRRCLASLTLSVCALHAWAAPQPASDVSLAKLPIEFEMNRGQHDPAVRFLSRAAGYQVGLTTTGATFAPVQGKSSDRPAKVTLEFRGGNQAVEPVGERQTAHRTHYLFDGAPAQRHYADIPNFEKVSYRGVYPGVDAVFYGADGGIEYDLVLQPGADPRRIELAFTGARKLEVDAQGDLLVHTGNGVLRQHKPVVYQEQDGRRRTVAAKYRVLRGNRVRFEVAAYDPGRPLTVDPVLSYSTYVGAALTEYGNAIAVDAAGNAYIAGQTYSTNFPVSGAYQGSLAGSADVFVAKLNPQGTGLVYSTYIGGRRTSSEARAIAVDQNGSAYITGTTSGGTYPVTTGAFGAAQSGGGAFVTKLSPSGNTLVYSTYLAGAQPVAIRVDAAGSAYVAGQSYGSLPTTAGALQAALPAGSSGAGFITKLTPAGNALSYSTYLGGAGQSIVNGLAVDAAGNAYVTGNTTASDFPVTAGVVQPTRRGGTDAFVAKLDPMGSALLLSTYLGGTAGDNGAAIAVDAAGRMYVAGDTYSTDFPRVAGYWKPYNSTAYNVAFVTVLEADAATIAMSTYLGGDACLPPQGGSCYPWDPTDAATAISVDAAGKNIHVGGYLSSLVVDWLVDAIQPNNNGRYDAFVAKIEVDPFNHTILNIRYATRFGGDGDEKLSGMAVDAEGNAYITGSSYGTTLPTTQGAFRVATGGQQDAFVAKISTLGKPIALEGSCYGLLRLQARLAADAAGTVEFRENGTPVATVPIESGSAAYTAPVTVGAHKYTAIHVDTGATSLPVYCEISQ